MKRRGAVALGCLLIAGWPSAAHADPAGASDWRSTIVSVEPASEIVRVSIEGGDAFVHIDVEAGHEVVITGYDGEPYLRIDKKGDVFENRNSRATYYNTTRYGTGAIPGELDASAAPEWSQVGDGGAWAWHDHRAHWMGNVPPPGVEPGDSLAPQAIPFTIDGLESTITVVTTLVDKAPWWLIAASAAAGLAIAAVAVQFRRARAPLLLGVSAAALLVGVVQFASLPSETGPSPAWWVMPAVATLAASTMVVLGGRAPLVRLAATLVAASQLVIWGWQRRQHVRRGVLPTELPFALDRSITVVALVVAVALVAAAVNELLAILRQAPRASSISAASDS